MLVKFPVWEYHNTQLGFSFQINSNTKRTFDSQKSKVLFCVHGAIISQPPCESIRSPSTVIPSVAEGSLLHCRHRHTCALTQTTPWCFLFCLSLTHGLPVGKKDPSTSVGMTGGRRVISHNLSHRYVDPSCAFGAPLL